MPGLLSAAVKYDEEIPQLALAAQEVNDALKEAGRGRRMGEANRMGSGAAPS